MHGLLFSEKNVEWYQTDGHKSDIDIIDIDSASKLPKPRGVLLGTSWCCRAGCDAGDTAATGSVDSPERSTCPGRATPLGDQGWCGRCFGTHEEWLEFSGALLKLICIGFGNLYLFYYFLFLLLIEIGFLSTDWCKLWINAFQFHLKKKCPLNLVTWSSVTLFNSELLFSTNYPVTGGISASTREKGQNKVQRLGWSPDPIHGSPYACHW